MKKSKIINWFWYLLYILLIIAFYKPGYVSEYLPKISKIYTLLKYLSFLLSVLIILINKKISKFNLYITLSQVYLLFITFVYSGNIKYSIDYLVAVFSICTIIDYGLSKNPKVFIKSMITIFLVYLVINFIWMIKYPNGIANYTDGIRLWFVGQKNTTILYIIPLLFLLNVYNKISNKKNSIIYIFVILLSLTQLIIGWSATSLIGFFVFVFGILFENLFKKNSIFKFKNMIISYIVLFFSIVVFRVQNIFKFIIVDILKKDLTFTGRTFIWDKVLNIIRKNIILGNGIEYSEYRYSKQNGIRLYSHNQLLEMIYKGGIVYILIISKALLVVKKKLDNNSESKYKFLFELTILVYLIMMLTEYYHIYIFIYIFCFAVNIDKLENYKEK